MIMEIVLQKKKQRFLAYNELTLLLIKLKKQWQIIPAILGES